MLSAFEQLVLTLVLDASASWLRLLTALAVSFVLSLFIGIWAARSERAGRLLIPIIDILQTLPILAFFPFVVYVVVVFLPPVIGINAAVVFLIITSMLWNMIFAVYEAMKTIPNEFLEITKLYRLGLLQRLRRIYIPASMPRLVEQSALSWAIGLFYLVTSEIFSTGSTVYEVHYGIGVALTQLAISGDTAFYLVGIIIFIIFVVATRFLLFTPLESHFNKHSRKIVQKNVPHRLLTSSMRKVRIFMERERLYKTARHRVGRMAAGAAKPAGLAKPPVRDHRVIWLGILAVLIIVLIAVFATNGTLLGDESLTLASLAFSFARVWLSFLIVLVVAVPLCVYIIFMTRGLSHSITLFQILASIPATIILPIIASAYAGTPYQGELVAFTIFFLSGIWYVVFSALADARAIPENLMEIKRLFHIRGINAWKKIYVRAIMPGLITGAVTGIAAMWNASIVAEYFTNAGISGTTVVSSVNTGIGKLLDISLSSNDLTLMVLALINLTVMIILINVFVWRKLYRRISDIYK